MQSKCLRNFCYFILCVSIGWISYLILNDANWLLGDDDLFVRTTMLGRPSHSWTGRGRFWPLGLGDYTILLAIPYGKTVMAHFIYNVVIMIASVMILFHFMNKVTNKSYGISLFYTLILFSLSSFVQIHIDCIYPERFMFFMQVLFMYFWLQGKKTQRSSYYICAWICSAYVIFSKEPVFGAVIVIALTNLVFGWKTISKKEKYFQIFQIISAVIYFAIYVYRFFCRDKYTHDLYGGGHTIFSQGVDAWNTISKMFYGEPVLCMLFLICIARAYYVFVKSDRGTLMLDSLLFGATAYVAAYVFLTMTYSYYVFPAVVFALPSFAYWTARVYARNRGISSLLMLPFVLGTVLSIKNSWDFIESVQIRRKIDVPMVERIVDSYLDGRDIFIFMNGNPIWMYNHKFMHRNAWEFNVFTHFTNYVLKVQKSSDKSDILIPLEKLEDASERCIIMCPDEADVSNYLQNNGFKRLGNVFSVEIYER